MSKPKETHIEKTIPKNGVKDLTEDDVKDIKNIHLKHALTEIIKEVRSGGTIQPFDTHLKASFDRSTVTVKED